VQVDVEGGGGGAVGGPSAFMGRPKA